MRFIFKMSALLRAALLTSLTWLMLCTVFFGVCLSFASAQPADKVLAQALKAMGGEQAVRRLNSWQAKGTIKRWSDGVTGRYHAAAMKPDLYSLALNIGGGEVAEGFNGKVAWRRDSREGLRTLAWVDSAVLRAEAIHRNHRWFDYKKGGYRLASVGQGTVAGKPAQIIALTTNRAIEIRLWFDTASGLLVKEELPVGEGMKMIEYSDYRPVGGIVEPFAIKLAVGGEQFDITITQVIHNPPLDSSLFDFPKLSNEPLPDIPTLLREVSENQDRIEALQEKYSCTMHITFREFDKSGVLREKKSNTFDVSFYRGRQIRRLVARNGQSLPAASQADEDRRVEKLIREIDQRETEQDKDKGGQDRRAKSGPHRGRSNEAERQVPISELLHTSRLINPRRERYGGRDVIVFDFEPLLGSKPAKGRRLRRNLSGTIWVDAADRQVARYEAHLADPIRVGGGWVGVIKSGAFFVREQSRIKDEVWLPTYTETYVSARAMFIVVTINSTITYSNYKRFQVEIEKEKLKDPVRERTSKP